MQLIINVLNYQNNVYPDEKGLSRILTEGNDIGNNCATELNEIKLLCAKSRTSKTKITRSANK